MRSMVNSSDILNESGCTMPCAFILGQKYLGMNEIAMCFQMKAFLKMGLNNKISILSSVRKITAKKQ